MKTRNALAAIAAVAILAFGASGMVNGNSPTPAPRVLTAVADNMPDVSGTIRWVNATTWTVLDDAGHTPTGIASVTVYPTYLQVNFDQTYAEVSSFQATVDESFASANVRVGASVSYSYARLFFYMPASGSTPVNPATLSKAGANVWLTGWFLS